MMNLIKSTLTYYQLYGQSLFYNIFSIITVVLAKDGSKLTLEYLVAKDENDTSRYSNPKRFEFSNVEIRDLEQSTHLGLNICVWFDLLCSDLYTSCQFLLELGLLFQIYNLN